MKLNHPRAQAIPLPHGGVESVLSANKVIRNTYLLLSLTLPSRPGRPACRQPSNYRIRAFC